MSLNEKAINIKGKQYVLVSDRIIYFNENYPQGSIRTELLSKPEDERVVVKATVYRDCSINNYTTGLSQAVVGDGYINKTSALENCETSAVGRALAMMGIGVIDSIASVDEINKTTYPQNTPVKKDNIDSKKLKITELCKKNGFKGGTAKDYEMFVFGLTGEVLEEKNYDKIITYLQDLTNI